MIYCLQSGHHMKKILLSLLILASYAHASTDTQYPQPTAAEVISDEEIPYKNVIIAGIYLKKYDFVKKIIEQNRLTEVDKGELLEFCEKYIGSLEEKQKTHKILKDAAIGQTVLIALFAFLTIVITSEHIIRGKKSLDLQRECLNVSDVYLMGLRTKYRKALDFYRDTWILLGKIAGHMQGRECTVDTTPAIDTEEMLSSTQIDHIRYFINPLNADARSKFNKIAGGVAGIGIMQIFLQLMVILGNSKEVNTATQDIKEIDAIKNLLMAESTLETSQLATIN